MSFYGDEKATGRHRGQDKLVAQYTIRDEGISIVTASSSGQGQHQSVRRRRRPNTNSIYYGYDVHQAISITLGKRGQCALFSLGHTRIVFLLCCITCLASAKRCTITLSYYIRLEAVERWSCEKRVQRWREIYGASKLIIILQRVCFAFTNITIMKHGKLCKINIALEDVSHI